ncbi:hypothetical protein NUU61_008022 [Penicillium alfredii]|uniref:Fungal N-terminal domain-containing protein n=1 Tax=Penicillium alfredii TaxID=1506179 RepID=A0A9W9JZ04_9EURO|nr:uncharacterized protein NUU61_008022 [Penicillium alfredii]KAJ5086715.1 hypothetical protein NUU61_008022 [Penicillium alfredii]
MSFGVSSGDIVLLTKFTYKILSSLGEDGPRSEYQHAEEECEAFLSLIEEIQSLDLSIVPESFQRKVFHYSTNMQRLVETFKKSIKQYEKSLGKNSSRGSIRSAPRKVQWALRAAADLQIFRKGLGNQIQIVQLAISTSIHAMISSRSQLLPMSVSPSHNLLNDGPYSTSHTHTHLAPLRYSPIVPPLMGGYQILHQVDHITNIVYERLQKRPDIQPPGRVHTLPDDSNNTTPAMPIDPTQRGSLRPSTFHSLEQQAKSQEETLAFQGTSAKHSIQQSLADDIDEYLTSMNLDKLSQAERIEVDRNDQLHPYITPSDTMRQFRSPQILGPANMTGSLQPSQIQSGSPNEPCSRDNTKASKFRRLDPLSAATSITGFCVLAAEFSLKLTNIFHDMNGECKEARLLSRKLGQYSELLQSAAGVIDAMSFSEELQGAGTSILFDNALLMSEMETALSGYARPYRYRLIRKLTWNLVKRDIMKMVEQIDFLKSSLSLMLQLYQVKMTECQIQMSQQSSRGENLQ